jgi:hypothetical protein
MYRRNLQSFTVAIKQQIDSQAVGCYNTGTLTERSRR